MKDLVELANAYRRRVNVLFRLSSENQFGVDSVTLKELIAGCKDDPFISIQGIQYYSGTQKTSLKKLDRELNKLHRIVAEVEAACSVKLNEIEYGPGASRRVLRRERGAGSQRAGRTRCRACNAAGRFPFRGGHRPRAGTQHRSGLWSVSDQRRRRQNDERAKLRDRRRRHASDFVLRAFDGHEVPCFQEGRRNGRRCAALEHLRERFARSTTSWPSQAPIVNLSVGDVLAFSRAGAYCATEGRALFLSRDLPSVVVRDVSGNMRIARHRLETASFNSSNGSQDRSTEQDEKENGL